MASMPDFIQAYHDEIYDESAGRELRALAAEYNQKINTLDKSRDAQHGSAKMQESFGGKPKKLDFASMESAFKNEYKLKAMQIAEPHIEDKERFTEIVKTHGPDPDYLKELDARKEEQERKMSDPNITASQEKMGLMQKEFQQQERARKIEELKKQWTKNKEMSKGG